MKELFKFVIENWFFITLVLAFVFVVVEGIAQFLKMPKKEQKKKVKEWLVWAVTQAEKELGEKTGQLKLRQVYDMFVQRFPAVAKAVSFDTFSMWVDEALADMRKMVVQNKAVSEFVRGK